MKLEHSVAAASAGMLYSAPSVARFLLAYVGPNRPLASAGASSPISSYIVGFASGLMQGTGWLARPGKSTAATDKFWSSRWRPRSPLPFDLVHNTKERCERAQCE
eukprot:scaffold495_cov405-Prasinococcus_capsulatus_cf.AAC.10